MKRLLIGVVVGLVVGGGAAHAMGDGPHADACFYSVDLARGSFDRAYGTLLRVEGHDRLGPRRTERVYRDLQYIAGEAQYYWPLSQDCFALVEPEPSP